MNAPTALNPTDVPASMFHLGSALRWLGHDCPRSGGRNKRTDFRHIGRKNGATYETPIIVAHVADGFVTEVSYGPEVCRTATSSRPGGCVIVSQGAPYEIAHIEPYNTQAGLRAFGYPRALTLKVLRHNEFWHLRCQGSCPPATRPGLRCLR